MIVEIAEASGLLSSGLLKVYDEDCNHVCNIYEADFCTLLDAEGEAEYFDGSTVLSVDRAELFKKAKTVFV